MNPVHFIKTDVNDIIGKKFGKLTVISYAGNKFINNHIHHYYNCHCDCSNDCVIERTDLLRGHVTSCHHCAEYDIIGKKFGKLTILSYAYKKGHSYYNCKCDCGNPNIIVVERSHLLDGHTQSCDNCTKYDIIGKIFGKLTVIRYLYHKYNEAVYECRCSCGNIVIRNRENLISNSFSCCYDCFKKYQSNNQIKHGMSRTKFYNIWNRLKDRCTYKNSPSYSNYGGRGITYDPRWNQFENFRDDMYESYIEACNIYGEENISIDRIDVNGNYCKDNCRFVDNKIQANNKRNNRIVTINDEDMTLSQAVDKYSNLSYHQVQKRLNSQNWNLKDALIKPIGNKEIGKRKTHCPVSFIDNNFISNEKGGI